MGITKYKLTDEAFADLKQKLADRSGRESFNPESIESARKIMVDGLSYVEVAAGKGQSRQSLHRIVRDLFAISQDKDPPSREQQRERGKKEKLNLPASWVRVAATLPQDLADKVKAMELAAIESLKKK